MQRSIANWETRFFGNELSSIELTQPIFIAGLARSGTTLLLELLALIDGIATHRYRDFPFIMTPIIWNRYLDRFPSDEQPVERAHGDGMYVTRESPEAFEEPLWQAFFPHVHSPTASHRLTSADANAEFDQFYREHLRKILFIRQGNRYLAKGNYNVARIEYLAQLFPDARFLVPIRHPRTHVQSLVRQHEKFTQYSAQDRRVPRYLAAAGHYEFGPQRIPTRITNAQGDRIVAAWQRGEEYVGYGQQWADVYGFVDTLQKTKNDLAERMLVVRYEDLCADPQPMMQRVLNHIGVDGQQAGRVFDRLSTVAKSRDAAAQGSTEWGESFDAIQSVAHTYGYRLDS